MWWQLGTDPHLYAQAKLLYPTSTCLACAIFPRYFIAVHFVQTQWPMTISGQNLIATVAKFHASALSSTPTLPISSRNFSSIFSNFVTKFFEHVLKDFDSPSLPAYP